MQGHFYPPPRPGNPSNPPQYPKPPSESSSATSGQYQQQGSYRPPQSSTMMPRPNFAPPHPGTAPPQPGIAPNGQFMGPPRPNVTHMHQVPPQQINASRPSPGQSAVSPPTGSYHYGGQPQQTQNLQQSNASSQPLHAQMGNMSLHQNGTSNGTMRPDPRSNPAQFVRPQTGLRTTGPTPALQQPQFNPLSGQTRPQLQPYVPPVGGALQSGQTRPQLQPYVPPVGGALQSGPPSTDLPQGPRQLQSQYPAYPPRPNPQPRPVNMRPSPGTIPTRPVPDPYNQQPNGTPQQPGAFPPERPSQSPQQPPQLTTSMVPRPIQRPCGEPRTFYYRGMTNVGDDRGAAVIPNSNSDYISIDDGCARIRFARLTVNAVVSEPNVMIKSGIPFAVVMCPFANLAPGEEPVPVVDFTNKQIGGPLRCERCNGYANPGFKFMNGGAEFQCNLCTHVSKTPTEHYSPISHTGERMDADSRPELRVGSVEYLVGSSDYWVRPPKPAHYLFAIDVSEGAVTSGLAASAMMSIKSAIGAGLLPGSNNGARIGIMTFDKYLHFFDGRGAAEGKSVRMHFVPDIMDPFIPVGGHGLFLTPEEAVHAVNSAIENHGLDPASNNSERIQAPHVECALGSALQVIKEVFADCGGKAFVFSGSIPTTGVSKLERRGGGALGGGEERELSLLKEANASYDVIGCELTEVHASVDLFLAPSSVYIDVATLSRVPRACGGHMHLFPGFDRIRDGASLHRSICSAASGPRAFEALLRVRTSPGIEARGEYLGHFGRPQRGDDISGPVLDASSSLALELAVTSRLLDDSGNRQNQINPAGASLYDDVCIQCAVLFTDCAGQRRIRVHTIFAMKTTILSDIFVRADVDATAAFLAKRVASAVLVGNTSFSKAWDAVMEKVSQMFYVYRKHCTASAVTGQLILPESYKVLPVMMLGLAKSAALRKSLGSAQSGDAVTIDERAAALSFLISATISEIAVMCYPRMWEIQSLPKMAGVPLPPPSDPAVVGNVNGSEGTPSEPIAMPNTLPLSAESLTDDRILLIENGMQIVVWIGSKADARIAQQIVATVMGGRVVIRAETANSVELLKDVGDDARRVGKVIERIVSERKGLSRPIVVERNNPGLGAEAKWVLPLLIEDRGSGGVHSYIEYLRSVHKAVMEKMSNDSAQSDLATWEMLNQGY